jgi:hypothetical protein
LPQLALRDVVIHGNPADYPSVEAVQHRYGAVDDDLQSVLAVVNQFAGPSAVAGEDLVELLPGLIAVFGLDDVPEVATDGFVLAPAVDSLCRRVPTDDDEVHIARDDGIGDVLKEIGLVAEFFQIAALLVDDGIRMSEMLC